MEAISEEMLYIKIRNLKGYGGGHLGMTSIKIGA